MRVPVLGSLVLVVGLLVGGCTGGTPAAKPAPTRSSTPAVDDGPALTTNAIDDGGDLCAERPHVADLGYWESTLTATTPLVITSVGVSGTGFRVVGSLIVPVVGGSVGTAGVTDWPPIVDRQVKHDIDWPARTRLVGAHLPVQRAMLPFLHLHGVVGGRMTAVLFRYRTDAGKAGVLRMPLPVRVVAARC